MKTTPLWILQVVILAILYRFNYTYASNLYEINLAIAFVAALPLAFYWKKRESRSLWLLLSIVNFAVSFGILTILPVFIVIIGYLNQIWLN